MIFKSESSKAKSRNGLQRNGNPNLPTLNKIPVVAIKDNKKRFFNSAQDAELILNIPHQNIRACCNKKRNHAGGYKWFDQDNIQTWKNYISGEKELLR
jgi:hypothetical protein